MVGSGGLGFVISMVSLVIHANDLIQEDEELVRDHYTLGGSCKKPSSPLPIHWAMRKKTLLGLKGPGVQVCKIPSIVVFRSYILMEFIPTQAVRKPFRLEPHAMYIIFQHASTQRKVPLILSQVAIPPSKASTDLELVNNILLKRRASVRRHQMSMCHRPQSQLAGDAISTPPGLGFETHPEYFGISESQVAKG
ncbi:hypothetical protein VNO77_44197 [Canavalia gladiata]|uniref:Uncharacterized protein n=1 Tax=Canavalia gladiata TaxID=3824 RepID=A0AAN9JY37_CANGL